MTRRSPRLWVAATVAVAGAVVAGSCGIPADESFREFDDDELAGELTRATTTTTTVVVTATLPSVPSSTPTVPDPTTTLVATVPFDVYFVIGVQLQAQSVALSDVTAAQVVAQLEQGPLQEGSVGLRTVVRPGLVREVRVGRGVLVVDLNGEVLQRTSQREQPLAIAQIGLSLAGLPRVGQLSFLQDGEPLAVPVPARDGEFSEPGEPLVFDDFAPLLASASATPTSTSTTTTTTTAPPPPPATDPAPGSTAPP